MRKTIIVIAFTAIVCFILPIGIYVWCLKELPIFAPDPQAWAHFGTYVGGVVGPVVGVFNLIAVVYIAIQINGYQQNQLATKRLSIDLLNEYNSERMHDARIMLDEFIEEVRVGKAVLHSLSAQERSPEKHTKHAFTLYNFFEKWAALAETKNLDQRLLDIAMGSRKQWWKKQFFDPILEIEENPDFIRTLQSIDKYVLSQIKSN